MKNFQFAILAAVCSASSYFAVSYAPMAELKRVTMALERERSFNVRHVRRIKWMHRPEKINLESVELAYDIIGIKHSVDAAILFCENGPEDVESGALSKTGFFTQFPIENRSGLEGGRALTRMAWEWFTVHDREAFEKFLTWAAYQYTKLPGAQQKNWAHNMMVIEAKFSQDISWANRKPGEAHLRNIAPTPTPVYHDLPDSPAKAQGKPKHAAKRK